MAAVSLKAQSRSLEAFNEDSNSCGSNTSAATNRLPRSLSAHDCSRHIDLPAFDHEFWAQWLIEQSTNVQLAQRGAAECLEPHSRLVVVAPHPDDEVLMCSSLIQHQVMRGGEIVVAALTDGEACFGSGAQRAAVGLERRAEAAAGLQALGAGKAAVHHFGLPDGALALHERTAEMRLRKLLRAGDLVVCTWRLDGHPDHEAAGRASAQACAAAGAILLESPVWMWHWARPDHFAIEWHRLARIPLQNAALQRKWDALQCHISQLTPRGVMPPVVDDALQARTRWPFECFFSS